MRWELQIRRGTHWPKPIYLGPAAAGFLFLATYSKKVLPRFRRALYASDFLPHNFHGGLADTNAQHKFNQIFFSPKLFKNPEKCSSAAESYLPASAVVIAIQESIKKELKLYFQAANP